MESIVVKFKNLLIPNAMLIANIVAVWSSALVSFFLTEEISHHDRRILELGWEYGPIMDWVYLGVVGSITIGYERPIRRVLKMVHTDIPVPADLALRARRRLLNEPYILTAVDFIVWLLAGVVVVFYLIQAGIEPIIAYMEGLDILLTAFITVTLVFFILQFLLQKWLAPLFFPEGRLADIPGTQKTSIRKTLMSLSFALNFIPLVIIIFTHIQYTYKLHGTLDMGTALNNLNAQILILSLIFMGVGVFLTLIVSRSLSRPLKEITKTLNKIGRGDLDNKVKVITNDEIGYTGDVINEMTEGLKERERLSHSMAIAHEVQQLLLPRENPRFQGLDIAGKSIYCEETGGDYYDFLELGPKGSGKIGVVVGDISGHGIGSALLMSSARALLRIRSRQGGALSRIINDVNRELSNDFGDSGQFLTLFYLVMQPGARPLTWVRAGHEPAITYNPREDSFSELRGAGIPIGLDEDRQYKEEKLTDPPEHQIILLATDGIWEARNTKGIMFGKDSIYESIRKNADQDSEQILESILIELKHFQEGNNPADDVTIVVIKT